MSDCTQGLVRIIPPSQVTESTLLTSNVPENEHSAYNAGATYANGARVIAARKIYENNSGGNLTGIYPPNNLTQWADLGFDNRWKMFDLYSSTITEQASSIIVELVTTESSNALVLLGLQASYVDVIATHPTESVIFNKRYMMQVSTGVKGLYSWLWRERTAKTSLIELAIPPYRGMTVRVEIHAPSGIAKCGTLILGRQSILGQLQWGYKWSLMDFSKKEVADDGVITIKKRDYASRPEFSMRVERRDFDRIARIAAKYRAEPAIWVVGTMHEMMTVRGFYRDFALVAEHSAWLDCSLQIEGLI